MANQRTGGMTTIGILNIVFGALGGLVSLLMVLGAGFMTAAGASAGGDEGSMVAAGGGILMLIGIAALAINVILFVSGIGILKVAPWGRSLSIAYGVLGVVIYGASLVTSEFSLFTVAALAYAVLLVGLCFSSSWKAAFCGTTPAMTGDTTPATHESDDETREAA